MLSCILQMPNFSRMHAAPVISSAWAFKLEDLKSTWLLFFFLHACFWSYWEWFISACYSKLKKRIVIFHQNEITCSTTFLFSWRQPSNQSPLDQIKPRPAFLFFFFLTVSRFTRKYMAVLTLADFKCYRCGLESKSFRIWLFLDKCKSQS